MKFHLIICTSFDLHWGVSFKNTCVKKNDVHSCIISQTFTKSENKKKKEFLFNRLYCWQTQFNDYAHRWCLKSYIIVTKAFDVHYSICLNAENAKKRQLENSIKVRKMHFHYVVVMYVYFHPHCKFRIPNMINHKKNWVLVQKRLN